MRKLCKPLSVLCAFLMVLPGCDFLREHQEAAIGAGVGAVAGGVLGNQLGRHGHRRGATVAGALVGALAGAAIGESLARRDRTPQQAAQAQSYTPAQGIVLKLDNVSATPTVAAPGTQVTLSMTYTLLAPNQTQEMPIQESWKVTFGGNPVGDIPQQASHAPGTWTSTVPVALPQNASKGQYDVLVSVMAGGQPDQKTTSFQVQ